MTPFTIQASPCYFHQLSQCVWHTGTQISDAMTDIENAGFQTVKGFATIDDVALVNVEV